MTENIRILIVDDVAETVGHVSRLLSFESGFDVVGTAGSGAEAVQLARELQPDVILMDLAMPGMDGIEATERISRDAPGAATVIMSVNDESDSVRRSMMAGARGYLVKPFNSEELLASIQGVMSRRAPSPRLVPVGPGEAVHEQQKAGKILAVFSPKGGVGTTTLAVNLAVAVAELGKSVALVDADLQFGDVGVLMNLDSRKGSFADVVAELAQGNIEGVDAALSAHKSQVRVLLAPPSPDAAELISESHMRSILGRLVETNEVVVVDCATYLNDSTLAVLDMADQIITPVSLDVTAILATRVFFDVADRLGYRDGKLVTVLNRADSNHGIRLEDVESSIRRRIDHVVVSDGRAAVHALNLGVPFVFGNRRARVSEDVVALARSLFHEGAEETPEPAPKQRAERRLAFARR